jgi:hypothetical protein
MILKTRKCFIDVLDVMIIILMVSLSICTVAARPSIAQQPNNMYCATISSNGTGQCNEVGQAKCDGYYHDGGGCQNSSPPCNYCSDSDSLPNQICVRVEGANCTKTGNGQSCETTAYYYTAKCFWPQGGGGCLCKNPQDTMNHCNNYQYPQCSD